MHDESTQVEVATDRFGYLAETVDRLVAGLRPVKIILFGSHARGTQSRHSDLDLFIVQETDESPLARMARASSCLPGLPHAVDVIVYRPSELAERQDNPFIRRVLREGIVLYDGEQAR